MVFLLRFVPKTYGAAAFGVARNDLRRRALSSSSSSSLFEQTIDLSPPEFRLPVLRSLHDAPPAIEKPSILQSIQQGLRQQFSIFHQRNVIVNAELLFQAVYHQSNDPRWFGPGRIGRDFRSRHALFTFHIWLLHRRLLLLNDHEVDTELFHIFWDNTLCRIRSLKVYELSVNKHLATVQQYSLVHMLMYDHAYSASPHKQQDPDQRQELLRQIVYSQWLHPRETSQTLDNDDDVMETQYRVTADHIDRLVWYIDTQYRNIVEDCPESRFASGQVPWVDLPDFANWHDSRMPEAFVPTEEAIPLHPEDLLPFPWRSNITNRGLTYYWNPQTREATWERPRSA